MVLSQYCLGALFPDSITRPIQDFMQTRDLRDQIRRMVANEETIIVCSIGVNDIANNIVVIMLNNIMSQEATTSDDPEADFRLGKGGKYPVPVRIASRIKDNGEGKGGTFPVFLLDNEALIT